MSAQNQSENPISTEVNAGARDFKVEKEAAIIDEDVNSEDAKSVDDKGSNPQIHKDLTKNQDDLGTKTVDIKKDRRRSAKIDRENLDNNLTSDPSRNVNNQDKEKA